MAARLCTHPLRLVPHLPQWLTCDLCAADFPHQHDCPGHGSTGCLQRCMGGAQPTDAEIAELLWLLPVHERTTNA